MDILGILLVVALIALFFNIVPGVPVWSGDRAVYSVVALVIVVWLLTRIL